MSFGVSALAFLALMASLVFYVAVLPAKEHRTAKDPGAYFLAEHSTTPDQFGDAQIAYALQMATIYPFFVFASTGLAVIPVVNLIFWAIGILLMWRWLPLYSDLLGKARTIHAFVASLNETPKARVVASCLTIIAFLGVALFEITFGAKVFKVVLGGDSVVYYLVIALFTVYLLWYLWTDGLIVTLRANQYQLVLGYVGLHASVAYLVYKQSQLNSWWIYALLACVCVFAVLMFVHRFAAVERSYKDQQKASARLYLVILVSLGWMIVSIARTLFVLPVKPTEISLPTNADFWGIVLASITLPVFWQFVDLSNWQRIGSLNAHTRGEYVNQARKGVFTYLLESPLSWALPVLLGVLAVSADPNLSKADDPFESFVASLFSGDSVGQILGILFGLGVLGIFMSTAFAAVSAIGYAFSYDVHRETRELMDSRKELSATEKETVIRRGRRFMSAATGAVVILFILIDLFISEGSKLIALLFAFYAPIISFSAAVVFPMRWRIRPHSIVTLTSMVVGAVLGIGIGIYAMFGDQSLQWYAAPIALAVSWGIYLLGLCVRRYPVIAPEAANEA